MPIPFIAAAGTTTAAAAAPAAATTATTAAAAAPAAAAAASGAQQGMGSKMVKGLAKNAMSGGDNRQQNAMAMPAAMPKLGVIDAGKYIPTWNPGFRQMMMKRNLKFMVMQMGKK